MRLYLDTGFWTASWANVDRVSLVPPLSLVWPLCSPSDMLVYFGLPVLSADPNCVWRPKICCRWHVYLNSVPGDATVLMVPATQLFIACIIHTMAWIKLAPTVFTYEIVVVHEHIIQKTHFYIRYIYILYQTQQSNQKQTRDPHFKLLWHFITTVHYYHNYYKYNYPAPLVICALQASLSAEWSDRWSGWWQARQRSAMETKQEPSAVWSQTTNSDSGSDTQVCHTVRIVPAQLY